MSGLLKLMYPDPDSEIPDDSIEWAARLALECRRRVKEQQKRIGSAEFRNTHFSYTLGNDGVEVFVATPELQSSDQIDLDPLPPGQVWAISPGGMDENPGLLLLGISFFIPSAPFPPKAQGRRGFDFEDTFMRENQGFWVSGSDSFLQAKRTEGSDYGKFLQNFPGPGGKSIAAVAVVAGGAVL